ncbi:MAG TPA: hypothetical protein VGG28_09260 [Kofleriaceae bacterium]
MAEHFDETGRPCTRHSPASPQAMLALALLGSRMPGFHHDVASKLQSLMMALEEVEELADTDDMRLAAKTASSAVREMQALFNANRSLARPPQRRPTPLRELVAAAAQRAGVRTHGELPAVDVEIGLSSLAHALAIVFDLAAGEQKLGRSLELATRVDGDSIVVELPCAAGTLPASAGETLALASFALLREQGELRCGPTTFSIRLPLQQ